MEISYVNQKEITELRDIVVGHRSTPRWDMYSLDSLVFINPPKPIRFQILRDQFMFRQMLIHWMRPKAFHWESSLASW
jgi:hypothetical protein